MHFLKKLQKVLEKMVNQVSYLYRPITDQREDIQAGQLKPVGVVSRFTPATTTTSAKKLWRQNTGLLLAVQVYAGLLTIIQGLVLSVLKDHHPESD